MMKSIGLTILLISAGGTAFAAGTTTTPEIDAASGVAALALLSGALLVLRARRKK
jgi:MYXO-CTERM domain-containing protein